MLKRYSSKLGNGYRIGIPQGVRELAGIKPDDMIDFIVDDETGKIEIRKQVVEED